jgi:hypothetical protein
MTRFWHTILARVLIQWLSPWTLVAGIVAFGLWRVLPLVESAAYNASATAYNARGTVTAGNDLLAALNAPCKDFQGDYICGPIPQLSQTEKNIGILAGKSAQQVQQTATLVNASAATIKDAGDSVKKVATALAGTAQQATDTLAAARDDLTAAKPSLDALPPLVSHADATVSDLDAILTDNKIRIGLTIAETANLTTNLSGIAANGRKVSDKLTADFVGPKPWYKRIAPSISDLWDFAALGARHSP